jgi:signal transduction histidine kinase/CheY-like chemotaxis protein/HAMP domain-containing protein
LNPARENKAHPVRTSKQRGPRDALNGRPKRTAEEGASRGDGLGHLLAALRAARQGNFSVRLSFDPAPRNGASARNGASGARAPKNGHANGRDGHAETEVAPEVMRAIAEEFNAMVALNEALASEMVRVERVVGREGRMTERASLREMNGGWAAGVGAINALIGDLVQPTTEVARVISAVAEGDFTQKMALEIEGQQVKGEFLRIGTTVNEMVDQLSAFAAEVTRVAKEVGTDGKLGGQADVPEAAGIWRDLTDNVNLLANNLTAQVRNIAEVTTAVARGDLSKKITVDARGEVLEVKNTVNVMVDQLNSFAAEVTRVAKEVGTEGKLGGQAQVPGVSGTWKDLTDNVNFMASNLTAQVRGIVKVVTAVANGDLSQKLVGVEAKGEIAALADTLNSMTKTLGIFAEQVTSVARTVGVDGKLGAQAEVPGVAGIWKALTDNVNLLANNLTAQVRNIAEVTTAVATGDLSKKITVDVKGEILELKNTINTMVDQLRAFAGEVTRVAKEVGTEGKLGGQADVKGVSGTWKDLTDNVNVLAGNLTDQVRNIAKVTTAVANGDLSQKITVDVKGEILELKNTINTMVDQLRSFAGEVTRVAKEVGTEGKLGGQAEVKGVSGVWKDLTDNVNSMASNLTAQVRNIALVTTAVANGDLSKKSTVDVKGEILELKNTINTMVDQLNAFASEVTRVAKEVGTEGKLGGQAEVPGSAGVWKNLTDNVNFMARNLTAQVRGIVQVVTAVANGDLKQKMIGVEAKGEIAALADTINNMCDTLGTFADQVSTVAREVGIEGKLGGQAKVPGAVGTWRQLTDNVNQLAGNLTTQVRAISEVSDAVTKGDLTRAIEVEAQGEVAALKDKINQMIINLRETTQKNAEQDWLKTNLAKFSSMMQGQKNLETVSRLIMSELTPLVSAHHGAFFMMDSEGAGPILKLTSTYAYRERKGVGNRFRLGESLIGQCAMEKKSILLTRVPNDYIQINSGLGEAPPLNIIVLPVLFEGEVKAVIELASFHAFSPIHQLFLDQLMESIGVVLNMIGANMRTEELLQQSQSLTQELQSQSKELTVQQDELKRSNSALEQQAIELEEKARLLAEQNTKVEVKNREVEQARLSLEEKAEQLSMISKYKSEFLANMSHELRTPLNSLLILARLLSDNPEKNLSDKQVEYAKTIYASGGDLLTLINEILDLSKVEAGKMPVEPREVILSDITDFVERSFRPLAEQKDLAFKTDVDVGVPALIHTDPQRLQQVLKNLLANALKFTARGSVSLRLHRPGSNVRFANESLREGGVVAFSVTDTGIGIARDKQQLIFEPFLQADGTTSRKYGGTGLGLSISRSIARLLGGEIHVESEMGKGSSFTLYLPEHHVASATDEALGEWTPPAASFSDLIGTPVTLAEADPIVLRPIDDDRAAIAEGDRVLLVVEDDLAFARIMLQMGRERGFKVIVATRGDTGLTLVNRYKPDAITLDIKLPGLDGLTLLDRLKRNPTTRHIPVHVISIDDANRRGAALGAFAYLEKPVTREALDDALAEITSFLDRSVRRLLLVEDDDRQRQTITELVGEGDDVEVTAVSTAEDAAAALEGGDFDCMVVDLVLPGDDGIQFLEKLRAKDGARELPVIVYTGKDLTPEDDEALRKLAQSVILKSAIKSPERLLSETALFLHRVESRLPERSRALLEAGREEKRSVAGRKVLVVDDDVRNIFAMTSVLEANGLDVIYAENGQAGIEALVKDPSIDLVLMDVMMPGMDGYETMRAIRANPAFRGIPIVAVTAKALKDDRAKCIAAGASDYLPKPVATEKLMDLIRLWTGGDGAVPAADRS